MYNIEKGVLDESCIFFNTPSPMIKDLFYYIKCAGHFICDKNYRIKRDSLDSILLMYVKSGEGKIKISDKLYSAKANDVILINCYNPHEYWTTTGWETLWIHFDGNLSEEYFKVLHNKIGSIIPSNNSTLIFNYMISIIDSFAQNNILNEAIISCHIQRILAELFMLSNDAYNDNSKKSDTINKSITFIRNHFKNKITINDVANHVNISIFHFSRTFKKETGYSPYRYINMIRLNHAKSLLKSTQLFIKEIAFECGFNSESNFVTSFKQHTNLTPTEFRNMPF